MVMDAVSDHQGKLQIPVHLDASALPQALGSYTATIIWNPTVLEYRSVNQTGVNGGQFVVNEEQAKDGTIKIAYANPKGLSGIANLFTLSFYEKGVVMEEDLALSFQAASTIGFQDVQSSMKVSQTLGQLSTEQKALSIYPNPMDGAAKIGYLLQEEGPVQLAIYNSNGQLVKMLVDEVQAAGSYRIQWNGTAEEGGSVVTGIYLISMKTQSGSRVLKAIVK